MAEVWECYDHKLEVWRAVKFLNARLAQRNSVLRRFLSEGHALARVQHPNVVRVYDVGQAGDRPYLLLELANGGSLEGYCRKHGPMDPRLAVDAMLQVAAGIQAAHDQQIVHRDIKPDNILVDRKGTCKVTDFGIAQIADDSSYTRTGSTMGTIAFMAPEQRKDAKNVSPAVDVYALGTTLFALLCNDAPTELFMAHHAPHLLKPIPDPLKPVILGAVGFEPGDRYPTAAAFAQALEKARDALPPSPPGTPKLITQVQSPPEIPRFLGAPVAAGPAVQPSEPDEAELAPVESRASTPTEETQETVLAKALDDGEARPDAPLPYFLPPKDEVARDNPSWIDEEAMAADEKEIRRQAALEKLKQLDNRRLPLESLPPDPDFHSGFGNRDSSLPPGLGGLLKQELRFPPELEPPAIVDAPKPTPDPPPEPPPPAAPPPAEEEEEEGSFPLALVTMAAFGFVFVLSLGAVAAVLFLSSDIRNAATLAENAEVALYQAIDQEAGVIDDLKAMHAETSPLEAKLASVRSASGPAKLDAASDYLTTVRAQVDTHAPRAPPEAVQQARYAVERADRLAEALALQRTRHKEWEVASRQGFAPTMCSLGVARCAK
ncbi:MAG: serine/threonine protein kinase [Alphaproteobacteria bacterium]|nr:serine/threonine protein kinase [Alphaproteobacteria bacterium]